MSKNLEIILTMYPLYAILAFLSWKWLSIYQENNNRKLDSILDIMKKQEEIIEELKSKLVKDDIIPIENKVEEAHIKIDKVDKKIDKVEEKVREELDLTKASLEDRIKYRIKEAIEIRAYLSTEERENIKLDVLKDNERRMLDLDILDKKIARVVGDVMDIYFKNNYFAREHAYDSNTGLFNMPNITEETKAKDVENIYNNFWTIMNKNILMRDLSLIYDPTSLDTKVFLIERYIVTEYSARIEKMIEDWQSIQENIRKEGELRRLEEQRAKDLEEAERKKKESEKGQLENAIHKIINEINGG